MGLEAIIQRLKDHFHCVNVAEGASVDLLQQLETHIQHLPNELLSFYKACNGIQVDLEPEDFIEGKICSVEEMMELYPVAPSDRVSRLVPLRADGLGNYDCLVIGSGIVEYSIIFWDHEIYDAPSYLLASSLLSYLDMWSEYLVNCFFPDGSKNPKYIPQKVNQWPWIGKAEKEYPWPLDIDWMINRDPEIKTFLSSDDVMNWLREQQAG